MVPFSSYARVVRLQGVAFASSLPSTEWTPSLAAASPAVGRSRPAVLLPNWALGAEPENPLGASQSGVVLKVSLRCVAFMIPFCQKSSCSRVLGVCKGWVLDMLLAAFIVSAFGATSLCLADPLIGCLTPLVATSITEPTNRLIALCHHTVRCTSIILIVPLSCHQGMHGSQGVVFAHCASTALRAATASGPVSYHCFPSVLLAKWTLTTYPRHLYVTMRFDVNAA